MNKCIFSGRAVRDADVRYPMTKNGDKVVAEFTLAVDGYNKDAKAEFVRLTAWDKKAEFCEKYVRKGAKFLVSCSYKVDEYTDNHGDKQKKHYFMLDSIEFCESKKAEAPSPEPTDESGFAPADDEELPFN